MWEGFTFPLLKSSTNLAIIGKNLQPPTSVLLREEGREKKRSEQNHPPFRSQRGLPVGASEELFRRTGEWVCPLELSRNAPNLIGELAEMNASAFETFGYGFLPIVGGNAFAKFQRFLI